MTARERRPIFTLRIEGEPGAAGIHALRALLKVLLRRHHFRCIDVHEIPDPPDDPAKKRLTVGDGKARAIAGIDRRSR
jgi:hypothetical protein